MTAEEMNFSRQQLCTYMSCIMHPAKSVNHFFFHKINSVHFLMLQTAWRPSRNERRTNTSPVCFPSIGHSFCNFYCCRFVSDIALCADKMSSTRNQQSNSSTGVTIVEEMSCQIRLYGQSLKYLSINNGKMK